MLLESANDAAVTLADGIAGSTSAFVTAMNERARELDLDDTSYANPIGLDAPDNYSSARDLAALAVRLLRTPRFARIVDLPRATLASGARERTIDNRNDLIASYPWVDGVKTGHTLQAGYLLVGAAHGRNGGRVVSVVMGEPSEAARDADTLALLRWGLARFERKRVLDPSRSARQRGDRVPRRARAAGAAPLGRPSRCATVSGCSRRVRAPEELKGPLPAGRRVGVGDAARRRRAPFSAWPWSPRPLYPQRGRCECSPRYSASP